MRLYLSHPTIFLKHFSSKYAHDQQIGGVMSSTIEIHSHKNMTAEQILEEIRYPLENLEMFLQAMTKMKIDTVLDDKEFTAIINTLHHQVNQISKAVQA